MWIEINQRIETRQPKGVTPLAGVWIEIWEGFLECDLFEVTPLAGVWIEILLHCQKQHFLVSLPLGECGLK